MKKIFSIEPAIDPANRPTFLLDWELTMKCNLDCDYCHTDIEYGGHNNDTAHPALEDCLKTIDFMYEYADRYMKKKPKWQRAVVLNIYGGESIFHPDIEQILGQVRSRHVNYDWPLTVTCTSNAVAGVTLWEQVTNLVDEFTISFHSMSLPKQRQQVLDNILYCKNRGKRIKVVFVMHNNPEYWDISQDAIKFCQEHDIKHIVKANDNPSEQWQYNREQFLFFKNYYQGKTVSKNQGILNEILDNVQQDTVGMGNIGRSCCGGRNLCGNQDLNHPVAFMPVADFFDWFCSVNWYFLYIKQVNGNVYYNKDCRMNFEGTVGPIGNLADTKSILDQQQDLLSADTVTSIQCKKSLCMCGYCAPKAQEFTHFEQIMKKHTTNDVKFKS